MYLYVLYMYVNLNYTYINNFIFNLKKNLNFFSAARIQSDCIIDNAHEYIII